MADSDERESFSVHEDLICEHSAFFKAACSKAWAETENKTFHLDSVLAVNLKFYVDWLYTQRKDIAPQVHNLITSLSQVEPMELQPFKLIACQALCKLWALGDFFGDPGFKNVVMDSLEDYAFTATETQHLHTVKIIVDESPPGCALHCWLVDQLIGMESSKLKELVPTLPHEMVCDVLMRYVSCTDVGGVAWTAFRKRIRKGKRKYHEHKEGERCARCKRGVESG